MQKFRQANVLFQNLLSVFYIDAVFRFPYHLAPMHIINAIRLFMLDRRYRRLHTAGNPHCGRNVLSEFGRNVLHDLNILEG